MSSMALIGLLALGVKDGVLALACLLNGELDEIKEGERETEIESRALRTSIIEVVRW